jgi:hypothetical protein
MRQAQCVGYGFTVCMSPLTTGFNGDVAILVHVGQSRFGLQIGVFLYRRLILAFHDYIGFGKGFVHIAFANLVVDTDIRVASVRMQDWRVGAQGNCRVGKDRQVFIIHFDQFDRCFCLGFSSGYHNCDLIANETDDIRVGLL